MFSPIDKRQDTENQLAQLRQFCETQDWPVVHEYVDRATGKHSDREQFQELFQAASEREFDVVLFWSFSRFSREGVRETLNHLERLTCYGVNWRWFTEQYFDSCGIFRVAVLGILATIARQERVRLSERTITGRRRARRAGLDRVKVQRLWEQGKFLNEIAAAGVSKVPSIGC